METLESSRVCRLCGQKSGISINMFDKKENHVKKINAILPITVHEMDSLPKHMCHRCSYKLEEFYKFYVDCLRTDGNLKSQLSWMQETESSQRAGIPMVQIESGNIKVEPPDHDIYDMNPVVDDVDYTNSLSSVTFPVNGIKPNNIPDGVRYTMYTRCGYCDKADQSTQTVRTNFENMISSYSRINDGCATKSRAVEQSLLSRATYNRQPSFARVFNKTSNSKTHEPISSSSPKNSSIHKSRYFNSTDDDISGNGRVVRNLRPRNVFIDYVEAKRKIFKDNVGKKNVEAKKIKEEKLDDFERRILRPRKGFVDYREPKRKYRSSDNSQSSPSNEHRVGKIKVSDVASKVKGLRKVPKLEIEIKKEQISDDDEMEFEMPATTVLSHCSSSSVSECPRYYVAEKLGRFKTSELQPGKRLTKLLLCEAVRSTVG